MTKIIEGSGNVFRDLGLKDAEEMLVKAGLTSQIAEIIEDRKLTQTAAARILGLKQPDVSNLLRGKLSKFSTGRLMDFLTLLGRDVEIVVKKRKTAKRQRGRLKVVAA